MGFLISLRIATFATGSTSRTGKGDTGARTSRPADAHHDHGAPVEAQTNALGVPLGVCRRNPPGCMSPP